MCICTHGITHKHIHSVTYNLLSKDLEPSTSGLEDSVTKMETMITGMIIHAAYHGYQPAPTGRAPNNTDTTAIITEYS